jgi:pimeloyl-ACP methyl ester carboxylesterase
MDIQYDTKGTGNPTMLFIHGGGGDRSHLQPQFDYFSQKTLAVNVDLLGYGQSKSDLPEANFKQHADYLAALCKAHNIHKIIPVGHSSGGSVALELARHHRDLVTAVVMISSGIIVPPAAIDGMASTLENIKNTNDLNGILHTLADNLHQPGDSCKEQVIATFSKIPQSQWIAYCTILLDWWQHKGADCVINCKQPMLYVQDDGGEFTDIEKFKELCPQLLTEKISGCGHFPTLAKPDEVNRIIENFLINQALLSRG